MAEDHDCSAEQIRLTFTHHELHVLLSCHSLVLAQINANPDFTNGVLDIDVEKILAVATVGHRIEAMVKQHSPTWHEQLQLRVMRELGVDTSSIEGIFEAPDPEAFGA